MSKEIKVAAFVGMTGSGKSHCVEHAEKLGFPSVYFGGITVDEVKRRGLKVNEANEKMVREELRTTEGPGVMANRIIPKIEALFQEGHERVVADGVYSWTEYKIFEKYFGKSVCFIAVAAPRHLRHLWLATRQIRPLTEEDAIEREYAEIENIEKGGPIANADYTIVNDGTLEELDQKVDEVLVEIGFIES